MRWPMLGATIMTLRRTLQLGYLLLVGLAALAPLLQPVAFQKLNSLEPLAALPPLAPGGSLDVERVVGAIPYRLGEVWEVEPALKSRRTLDEGLGNCSQKTFGLAWQLDQAGVDFQIVHLLPVDGFLRGGGHTLIRTHYQLDGDVQVGLVDLLQGAIPMSADRSLDVASLGSGPVPDFRFRRLAEGGEDAAVYYGAFLEEAVIGLISAQEVSDYFAFLNAVYVPLGSGRLEKYAYDGLALLLGYLPKIQALDLERLLEGRRALWLWHNASAWILRSALVGIPLLVLEELFARRRRRRSGWAAPATR